MSKPNREAPPSPRVRVKRLPDRGAYDKETVYGILDAAFTCAVGYAIDGQPYVTPTIHWREGDHVYWHGSAASRMMERIADGIAACLTVSLIDGLVLARSAFHHSINYRSVMVLGTAKPVTDRDAKIASLKAMMARVAPGRWDQLRPVNDQELKATMVLSMSLAEASAKLRAAPPADDAADLTWPVWAGVLPILSVTGTPVADAHVPAGLAPDPRLTGFRIG